jgi:hypothetical protein
LPAQLAQRADLAIEPGESVRGCGRDGVPCKGG